MPPEYLNPKKQTQYHTKDRHMISFDFSGQTAVVTGGTRGIGAAVTTAFLKAGANVYAIYASNDQAAESFNQQLGDLAQNLTIAKCNVADATQAKAFFDSLPGAVEILVNSAGIRKDGVAAMLPNEDWQAVIDINLTGTFNMTKLALLNMLQKRYGRIINLTSPSGQIGIQGQSNYAASKAGIVALTKSISREVARRNITVNAVSPGFIDTDFIAALPPEQVDEYKKSVPLRRFGKAEEVADAILFLATRQAAYITGSVLSIDGGL